MKLRQLYFAITTSIIIILVTSGCGGSHATTLTPVVTGNLMGFVMLDQGNLAFTRTATNLRAVEGAIISVKGYPALIAISKADGSFELDKIPAGIRTFYISKVGYTRVTFQQTIQEGNNAAAPTDLTTAAKFKWTVMVYMSADNNMTDQSISDMNELEMVGSTTDVKLLVQMDRLDSPGGYEKNYPSLTGCRRFEVTKDTSADPGKIVSTELAYMGAIDSGNPQTLNDFVTWGQTYAPAEHYLVVLWNHGSGWNPTNDRSLLLSRAIGYDQTSNGHWIKIPDLNYSLTALHPIDVVAMDACYMSMAEVAYQIRGCAEYMVGSEEASPWIGYAYQNIAAKLTDNPATTSRDLANFIAQDAMREWINEGNESTHSVIDLGQMDALVEKLNPFCDRLIAIRDNYQSEIVSSRVNADPFSNISKDLYTYVSLLRSSINDTDLQLKADALMAQIKNSTVVSNYTFSLHSKSAGLAIDLQTPYVWTSTHSASYSKLKFAADSHWDEWMAAQ
ncbi:MAG: clostripain-related cysteine peptidase [bacterium]